ncbi:MAG: alpha/beta hydrolase [Rubripirellula sp.]|jgi:pimeloyl-ACP methyl ester carboxylesterase|nr:alpha/beta hydrolase [Planctomycetaceae bacterium]MDF1840997.1 alpha/beta hydrolase [Rubripirellula sp.]
MEHYPANEFTEKTALADEMIRRPIESFQRYLLDRMVLRPSRQPIEFAPQQRVMLCNGSSPIECFMQANFDADRFTPELVVLKFPGTAGRAERSGPFPMSILSALRIAMWTWNPPGYGRSTGPASLPKIGTAAVEFWDQVMGRYPHQTPIMLCGNSLGCLTALNVAVTTEAIPDRCGVVLRNPPLLKPVFKREARRYPLGVWAGPLVDHLCDSMDAMATARRCYLPAVFLQSELDQLVPASYQNRLIRAYRGPKRTVILEGLGHDCIPTENHQLRIEQSIHWLWENLATS